MAADRHRVSGDRRWCVTRRSSRSSWSIAIVAIVIASSAAVTTTRTVTDDRRRRPRRRATFAECQSSTATPRRRARSTTTRGRTTATRRPARRDPDPQPRAVRAEVHGRQRRRDAPGVTADTIRIGYYIAKPDPHHDALLKAAGAYDPPANSRADVQGLRRDLREPLRAVRPQDRAREDPGHRLAAPTRSRPRPTPTRPRSSERVRGDGRTRAGEELRRRARGEAVLCIGTCIIAQPQKFYRRALAVHLAGRARRRTRRRRWSSSSSRSSSWASTPSTPATRFQSQEAHVRAAQLRHARRPVQGVVGRPRQAMKDAGVPLVSHVTTSSNLATLAADGARLAVEAEGRPNATTSIFTGDPIFPQYLTKEMTKQNYFPEWVMSGTVFADTNVFARTFDQKQWAHAFGLQLIPARLPQDEAGRVHGAPVVVRHAAADREQLRDHQGRRASCCSTGLQLAGPKLTPETFQDGMYAHRRRADQRPARLDTIVTYGNHGFWPTRRRPGGLDNVGHPVLGPEGARPRRDRHRRQRHVPAHRRRPPLPAGSVADRADASSSIPRTRSRLRRQQHPAAELHTRSPNRRRRAVPPVGHSGASHDKRSVAVPGDG